MRGELVGNGSRIFFQKFSLACKEEEKRGGKGGENLVEFQLDPIETKTFPPRLENIGEGVISAFFEAKTRIKG